MDKTPYEAAFGHGVARERQRILTLIEMHPSWTDPEIYHWIYDGVELDEEGRVIPEQVI